jgi:nucleotide-binding universal stress UspA family protein
MKILLATDGSEYSALAARLLSCLNLSPEDEILIFHAIYWLPHDYIDAKSYIDSIHRKKKEVAPRVIDATMEMLKSVRAKISTAIKDGLPEQCIVDAATDADADLIVMGARGIKGIKSFFIGSVTNSVALSGSTPVLISKPPGFRESGKLKILFANDGSNHAIDTGKFLSGIPFPDNTEITILNVVSAQFSLNIPESFYPAINKELIAIEQRSREMEFANSRRILEQAREYLSKSFSKVEVLSEVGDPSTEILKASETLKSDIIAVGCRGLRGLKGIMGSVSRNVFTHSKCSVLIGKMCM